MQDLAGLFSGAGGPADLIQPFTPAQMSRLRRVLARSPYYVDDNAFLRVQVSNVQAGVTVEVHIRISTPAGEVKATRLVVTPTTDASLNTKDFALTEGLLFNVVAFAGAGAPIIGQTYVRVLLLQASGSAATVLAVLVADYVTQNQGPGYPGSPVRTSIETGGYYRVIQGTQPGAGLEIVESVPAGRRWDLISMNLGLTTTAAAANRWVLFNITNSLLVARVSFANAIAVANNLNRYFVQQMATLANIVPSALQADFLVPLPEQVIMDPNDSFTTQTFNIQAGDQWSAPVYVVREWLKVN